MYSTLILTFFSFSKILYIKKDLIDKYKKAAQVSFCIIILLESTNSIYQIKAKIFIKKTE